MTDIDFDELDKAVNSLMGGVSDKAGDDEQKPKTLTISTTLQPGEKPTYERLGEVAKTIGGETLVTAGERTTVEELSSRLPTSELAVAELDTVASGNDASPPVPPTPALVSKPAVKRPNSGRFMDVVHPSSDMRPPSSDPTLVVPERPSPDTERISAPLPEKTIEKPTPVKSEPVEQLKTLPAYSADQTPTTPFLPDAKVEKRPLGGVASLVTDEKVNEVVETSPVNSEPILDTNDNDEQRPLDPKQYEAKESVDELTLQNVESTEVIEPVPEKSLSAVESGDTEKLSSGLVQQQYPEEATGTPEAAGAIYDVKNYHQPLGHPAKQKSGWGVVALIALIIIVCAAIGAAAYFILGSGF